MIANHVAWFYASLAAVGTLAPGYARAAMSKCAKSLPDEQQVASGLETISEYQLLSGLDESTADELAQILGGAQTT